MNCRWAIRGPRPPRHLRRSPLRENVDGDRLRLQTPFQLATAPPRGPLRPSRRRRPRPPPPPRGPRMRVRVVCGGVDQQQPQRRPHRPSPAASSSLPTALTVRCGAAIGGPRYRPHGLTLDPRAGRSSSSTPPASCLPKISQIKKNQSDLLNGGEHLRRQFFACCRKALSTRHGGTEMVMFRCSAAVWDAGQSSRPPRRWSGGRTKE